MQEENLTSRRKEFRTICQMALNLSHFQHYSPVVVVRLYENEVNKLQTKYPDLTIESSETLSNELTASCTIYKKRNKQ